MLCIIGNDTHVLYDTITYLQVHGEVYLYAKYKFSV